jgi:hypothetical protein
MAMSVEDVTQFILEDRYQNSPLFRVDNLKMEALSSFETMVSIYQFTWDNISEDCMRRVEADKSSAL